MNKLIKKHAVMMEYVIVAVLVAAVVVVAVIFFGRSVKSEFNVAGTAMFDAKDAQAQQGKAKTAQKQGVDKATKHAEKMHKYDGTGK